MKRTKTVSLGDALRDTLAECRMNERLDEIRAAQCWPMVVGARYAAMSPRPTVRGGLMTVRLQNASLRQELTLNRTRLVAALNAIVGRNIINDIRFIAL